MSDLRPEFFVFLQLTLSISYGWKDPSSGRIKTLTVVYQYGAGDLQCIFGNNATPILTVSPVDAPRTMYTYPQRAGNTNVVALVWGIMTNSNKMSPSVIPAIMNTGSCQATNTYLGFDGEPGTVKSLQVFYRYGLTGNIKTAVVWEGNTLQLAPRSVQFNDPLPGRGVLRADFTSLGFWVQSSITGLYWQVANGKIVASAKDQASASVFAYQPTVGATPAAMAVVSPSNGQITSYVQIAGNGMYLASQLRVAFSLSTSLSRSPCPDYAEPICSVALRLRASRYNGQHLPNPEPYRH